MGRGRKEDLGCRRVEKDVKRMMRESKAKANEEWNVKLIETFKESKNIFWRRVNEVRLVSTNSGGGEGDYFR